MIPTAAERRVYRALRLLQSTEYLPLPDFMLRRVAQVAARAAQEPRPADPVQPGRKLVRVAAVDALDLREVDLQVLGLVASGSTNVQVCAALILSKSQVERVIRRLYGASGESTRQGLARWAERSGLVETTQKLPAS